MDSVRSGSVKSDAGTPVESLRPLVEELAKLERFHSYLLWVKQVSQLWLVTIAE